MITSKDYIPFRYIHISDTEPPKKPELNLSHHCNTSFSTAQDLFLKKNSFDVFIKLHFLLFLKPKTLKCITVIAMALYNKCTVSILSQARAKIKLSVWETASRAALFDQENLKFYNMLY